MYLYTFGLKGFYSCFVYLLFEQLTLPGFPPGSSRCLPSYKDMQVRLTADSKFLLRVNMGVNGCLSLRVCPVIDSVHQHVCPILENTMSQKCLEGIYSDLAQVSTWTQK